MKPAAPARTDDNQVGVVLARFGEYGACFDDRLIVRRLARQEHWHARGGGKGSDRAAHSPLLARNDDEHRSQLCGVKRNLIDEVAVRDGKLRQSRIVVSQATPEPLARGTIDLECALHRSHHGHGVVLRQQRAHETALGQDAHDLQFGAQRPTERARAQEAGGGVAIFEEGEEYRWSGGRRGRRRCRP